MGKIGFCCKWIDNASQIDGIGAKDDCRKYNTGSTTVAWLKRQPIAVAEQKLYDLMVQNIQSVYNLVERVSTLPDRLRMVRIGSDVLPVYTEANFSYFWKRSDVRAVAEKQFALVGDLARANGVRLSFHPGQFTVLASESDDIVDRSIAEFEYHADMARMMGYGKTFQDFKINVHISGRRGPDGIRAAYNRLSVEARNCITIENEENSWGLDDCLELADTLPIVLDIHHHFIHSGEYIMSTDDRYKRVIDSWRDIRPIIHYSYSRDEHLPKGFAHDTFPDMTTLLQQGCKKQKLRAHSNRYPNSVVNKWALSFLDTADIMCESKMKNLASFALAKELNI